MGKFVHLTAKLVLLVREQIFVAGGGWRKVAWQLWGIVLPNESNHRLGNIAHREGGSVGYQKR